MLKPILTIAPNPMVCGQRAKITGPAGSVITLTWNPSGGGVGELVLDENGEAVFWPPSSGTGSVVATSPGCTGTASTYGP